MCIQCFFFVTQKTAYDMRISDWSSDVCSSDLFGAAGRGVGTATAGRRCARRGGRRRRCPGRRDPLFPIPNPQSPIPASAGGQTITRPRRLWLMPVSIIAALLLGLLPLPPLVKRSEENTAERLALKRIANAVTCLETK